MGKNYNKKYGQNFSFEGKPVEIAEEILDIKKKEARKK